MTIDLALDLLENNYPCETSVFMHCWGYYFSYQGIKYRLNEIESWNLSLYNDQTNKLVEQRDI